MAEARGKSGRTGVRRRAVNLRELGFTGPGGMGGLGGLGWIGLREQTAVRGEDWGRRRMGHSMEFCYVVSGRQAVRVSGETVVLGGNDLLVNPPGEWHTLAGNVSERCRLYYFSFGLGRRGSVLMLPAGESEGVRRALRALPRRMVGTTRTAGLFEEVLRAASGPEDGLRRVRVRAAALSLVAHVLDLRGGKAEAEREEGGVSGAVGRVVAHVRGRPGDVLDVGSLAAVAGLSVSRLHARFKRETGFPPREFVLRTKVEAAGRMLRAGRDVTGVAAALGFSSTQYFATVFRRYTGRAPSEVVGRGGGGNTEAQRSQRAQRGGG